MKLKINNIAARLEALEETIIFKIITRAQYKKNPLIYQIGKSGFKNHPDKSLFGIRLLKQEELEAVFNRYSCPEERPFNTNLPKSERDFLPPESPLHIDELDKINLTEDILKSYLGLVDEIAEEGNDPSQYGSSIEHDVYALQAISERVHFGAFYVAETKYQSDPDLYQPLIDQKDEEGILIALTRAEVERRILERVREKTKLFQKDVNAQVRRIIDPALMAKFYEQTIIPLTKKGEVLYLLQRK